MNKPTDIAKHHVQRMTDDLRRKLAEQRDAPSQDDVDWRASQRPAWERRQGVQR